MDDEFASNPTHILLGRSFMKTTRTKIDVRKGTFSFEFDGEIVTFNIFNVMKYPEDSEFVFHVVVINLIVQNDYEHSFLKDELNFVLQHNKTGSDAMLEKNKSLKELIMSLHSLLKMPNRLVNSPLQLSNFYERVLPYVE
jgi:hypothetical protein